MRCSDLQPANLAWLRERYYINGFGPRSMKFGARRVVLGLRVPTPGITPCCEDHDLVYLLGGSEADRLLGDMRLQDDICSVAKASWFGTEILLYGALPGIRLWLSTEGVHHFRYTANGMPRTEAELMRELRGFI